MIITKFIVEKKDADGSASLTSLETIRGAIDLASMYLSNGAYKLSIERVDTVVEPVVEDEGPIDPQELYDWLAQSIEFGQLIAEAFLADKKSKQEQINNKDVVPGQEKKK